ncbi:hypothetical protein ANN_13663 [Periplaneta americana]|uniref:Uncharacterized protein n=1 Tax=Periplaneta americana TaxID=6978 RepID=A0ABQ8TLG8_PERAM|nr:hypothetical protein ANN_13663 [Periplaneta americana]
MHDGTPAHFLRNEREHLTLTFQDRWIDWGCPTPWHARFPNLNPLDFWLSRTTRGYGASSSSSAPSAAEADPLRKLKTPPRPSPHTNPSKRDCPSKCPPHASIYVMRATGKLNCGVVHFFVPIVNKSLMLTDSEFQSLGRAIVKEDEYEEVRWDEHYSKIIEVIDALDSTDSYAAAAVKSLPSEQLLEDILFIDSNFKIVSKSIILLESSKLQLSEALNIVDKVSQTVIQNNNSLISEKVKLSKPEQASQYRSSTRVCVRNCVSIRRPEFECSGPQLEGPKFECSGPQLEGPEFEYSGLYILRYHTMKEQWNGEKYSPAPGFEPGFSALRADALSTKPHRIPPRRRTESSHIKLQLLGSL